MFEQKQTYNQNVTLDEFNQTLSSVSQIKVAVEKLIQGIFKEYMPRFKEAYTKFQPILEHFFNTEKETYKKVVEEVEAPFKKAQEAQEVFFMGKASIKTANIFKEAVEELEELEEEWDDWER